MAIPAEQQFLTFNEARAELRVGEYILRKAIKDGDLHCHWFGRLIRIRRCDLDDYIARSGNGAGHDNG